MLEIIKGNPYALLGIMLVADIIGVAIYAVIALKKNKKSALKKILITTVALLVIDGAYGIYVFKTNTFYDRNGEKYTSMEAVIYYDTNGKAYKSDGDYFVSLDGTDMFLADRAYVGEDGFLVYDKNGEIHATDLECIYKDNDGNKYYKATEIKWNSKGEVGIVIS